MQLHISNFNNSAKSSHVNNETNSVAKTPSKIGILILFLITITLYGFGISELNKTVINIIQATVKETAINY